MTAVIVSIVRDGGHAATVGMQQQDIIYQVNGETVTDPQQVTDRIASGSARITAIRSDQLHELEITSATLGVVLNMIEFDLEAWETRRNIARIPLSTAPTLPGREITETLDIVGAQCVYGVNALADLAGGLREFVGGRSQGLQNKIAEARSQVCQELREAAHQLGGNAVIAVTIEHAEIGDKGGFMLMVTGTGTAVITR